MKNIVHLCDCMDFMEGLQDNAYDLAIVDPPYGLNVAKSGRVGGTRKGTYKKWINEKCREYEAKNWDSAPPPASYFDELFRVSKHQIIWGGNYFLNNLRSTPSIIVWNKHTTGYFSDGELAWASFDSSLRIFDHLWNGFAVAEGAVDRIHPTQKPVALYSWCLQNYAKPGQTIFDSHVGSGSIRIACHDLGFDFEGCEIDEDYWKAQEERYKRHAAQGSLFENDELQRSVYNQMELE